MKTVPTVPKKKKKKKKGNEKKLKTKTIIGPWGVYNGDEKEKRGLQ